MSFLPYNRGSHPNFWSFVENTPKGVSIHEVSNGIDDGDIIFPYMSESQRTGDSLTKGVLQIAPSRGLMLIFPSWLLHCVYPFIGKEERRSIAFNANYQVFTRSEEMREGKPVVEWLGGNTTAVQHEYTYWDKTKVKGETK